MRFPGLILASVVLLFLTACGGSDGNGDDDGSSPSSSDSTQSSSDEPSSDDGSSEGASDDESSSDEASEDEATETGSVEDLEEAFTGYTKAFFQGKHDKALEYYTDECQEQTQLEEFEAGAAAVKDAYAADFKLTITSADVKDDTGKVEATYGIPEVDEAHEGDGYDWLYVDGEWRLNACY